MANHPDRSPADRIIDRFCPDISEAERELARERLHRLARVLIKIERRHAIEEAQRTDSTQSGADGRIPPTP